MPHYDPQDDELVKQRQQQPQPAELANPPQAGGMNLGDPQAAPPPPGGQNLADIGAPPQAGGHTALPPGHVDTTLPPGHVDTTHQPTSPHPPDVPGPRQPQGPQPADTAAPPPPPPAAPTDPLAGAYRDSLMKMLTDNQQTPSINDPALKAQADAYSLAQTRAKQRARSALAERMSAPGGAGVDSGSFENSLRGFEQAQGESEAGYNAGLVGNELQQRRQQLLSAASLAGNQLNAEDARALQKELAQLDAAIKRESIAQQGALGNADIALRGELGRGQLNLGLLQALQQGRQFDQSLGANVGMFNAGQSNSYAQALMNMLGG